MVRDQIGKVRDVRAGAGQIGLGPACVLRREVDRGLCGERVVRGDHGEPATVLERATATPSIAERVLYNDEAVGRPPSLVSLREDRS
ncbi:hypothetical protein GCM10009734_27480 [Nonomuraea bangladeshensis]